MTATITNKTLNTATVTDKVIGSQGITFAQDIDTFAANIGTFDNPFAFSNKSENTGSITNKTIS